MPQANATLDNTFHQGDVFKILTEIEDLVVGIDPDTQQRQEGFFASFRNVGLPIRAVDFQDAYSPFGTEDPIAAINAKDNDAAKTAAVDPKDSTPAGSGNINPDTKKAIRAQSQAYFSFLKGFELTDSKLRMNNVYEEMPGDTGKISNAWKALINGINETPDTSEKSDAVKAEIVKMKAVSMTDKGGKTPEFNAYTTCQKSYRDAVSARSAAYARASKDPDLLANWGIDGVVYEDAVRQAWDDWSAFGYKEEIEAAVNYLASQGMNPVSLLISDGKYQMKNSMIELNGIGEIPFTFMIPGNWYDKDVDDGWYDYTYNRDSYNHDHSSSSTSYGGDANYGFWASASLDHEESKQSCTSSGKDLTIRLKYCVVDIIRPWLDTSVLTLKDWFLVGDYTKGCISNGTMGQEMPASEAEHAVFLPSITSKFILVKDLYISWDTWKQDFESAKSSTTVNASVGFGCFAVDGNYSTEDGSDSFASNDEGESLHVPGVQLLGYVSTILPMSPQQDSKSFMQAVKPATAATSTTTAQPAGLPA